MAIKDINSKIFINMGFKSKKDALLFAKDNGIKYNSKMKLRQINSTINSREKDFIDRLKKSFYLYRINKLGFYNIEFYNYFVKTNNIVPNKRVRSIDEKDNNILNIVTKKFNNIESIENNYMDNLKKEYKLYKVKQLGFYNIEFYDFFIKSNKIVHNNNDITDQEKENTLLIKVSKKIDEYNKRIEGMKKINNVFDNNNLKIVSISLPINHDEFYKNIGDGFFQYFNMNLYDIFKKDVDKYLEKYDNINIRSKIITGPSMTRYDGNIFLPIVEINEVAEVLIGKKDDPLYSSTVIEKINGIKRKRYFKTYAHHNGSIEYDRDISYDKNYIEFCNYEEVSVTFPYAIFGYDILLASPIQSKEDIEEKAKQLNIKYDEDDDLDEIIGEEVKGLLDEYDYYHKKKLEEEIKNIKAFAPCENKLYHKLTQTSTTKSRLCIYETYYYLYRHKEQIYKIKEEIKNELIKENKNIFNCVKNGELLNFLKLKSIEHDEVMYVEFFDKTSYNGFTVYKDKIEKIEDLSLLAGKKVFLYFSNHVAPRKSERVIQEIYEDDDEEFENKKNLTKKAWGDKVNKIDIKQRKNYKLEGKPIDFINDGKKAFKKGENKALKNGFKLPKTKKGKEEYVKKQNLFLGAYVQSRIDKSNNFTIMAYDYETFNDNYISNPYCVSLSNAITYSSTFFDMEKLKLNKKNSFYGKDCTKEFVNFLDTIKIETNVSKTNANSSVHQYIIYGFNNSRFDNLFLFNELHNRNPLMEYIIDGSTIKHMKYHNISFFDLSLYYCGTLRNVATEFGLELSKATFPYKFVNKNNLYYDGEIPELKYWESKNDMESYIKNENTTRFNMKEYTIKYCELDTLITRQIAEKHLLECQGKINTEENKYKDFDARKCITAAGLSIKILTQVFLDKILYKSPDNVQLMERRAFKGGRTEVFKKYYKYDPKTHNKLTYIDINSSYPFSMTYKMPIKYLSTVSFKKVKMLNINNIVFTNLYKARVKYIGKDEYFIPNILVKSDKGDIIGTKDTETYDYHWGIELAEAISNGCEVHAEQEISYEADYVFDKFVNYFYSERLKHKETNPIRANFYKLILNSAYGKFGQASKVGTKVCGTEEEFNKIIKSNEVKIESFDLLDNNKLILKYRTYNDNDISIGNLVRFSSYIAAVSRSNLSKMMRAVGHNHVYYCDTDSVFIDVEPPKSFIHKSELGKWKVETVKMINKTTGEKENKDVYIDEAFFLAPKTYRFVVKNDDYIDYNCMKAKGQPSYLLKPEFYESIRNNNPVELTNDKMFFRSMNGIKIKPQSRTMDKVYNKRKWIGDNSIAYKSYSEWYNEKYINNSNLNINKLFNKNK